MLCVDNCTQLAWSSGLNRKTGRFTPSVTVKYRRNFITEPIQTEAPLASGLSDFGDLPLMMKIVLASWNSCEKLEHFHFD